MLVIPAPRMNHQAPQAASVTVQTVLPAEILVKQQALLERQGNLIRELVTFETQLKADESVVPKPSETKQYLLRHTETKEAIVKLRAMIAETREQLAVIQTQTTEPAFAVIAQPPELIFGHTAAEVWIGSGFFLLFPLVVAIAIRIIKRGSSAQSPISADRFSRLETAMESVAVEVERLGESQRFTSKLLNEAQPKQQPSTVKPSYDRLMRTPV